MSHSNITKKLGETLKHGETNLFKTFFGWCLKPPKKNTVYQNPWNMHLPKHAQPKSWIFLRNSAFSSFFSFRNPFKNAQANVGGGFFGDFWVWGDGVMNILNVVWVLKKSTPTLLEKNTQRKSSLRIFFSEHVGFPNSKRNRWEISTIVPICFLLKA